MEAVRASSCQRSLNVYAVAMVLLAATATLLLDLQPSSAQVFSAPPAKAPNPSQLQCKVESMGGVSVGYHSFRVQLSTSSNKPSTRERTFTVRISDDGEGLSFYGIDATAELTFPEGETSAEIFVPVYQTSYGLGAFNVEISEGSRVWSDLSVEGLIDNGKRSPGYRGETRLSWMVVDSRVPSVAVRNANAINFDNTQEGFFRNPIETPVRPDWPEILRLTGFINKGQPPAELPQQWSALSTFDGITIRISELKELTEKQPKSWEALRRWFSTGRIIVVDAEAGDVDLFPWLETFAADEFDVEWLEMQPGAESARNHLTDGSIARVQELDIDLAQLNGFRVGVNGHSTLVVLNDSVPTAAAFSVYRSLSDRWELASPSVRNGYLETGSEPRVFNWLVPGAGLPPVYSFFVLITLFAITIGPLNYIILRRYKRIDLLTLTIPIGSMLTVAGLLIFAWLMDGVAVRGRRVSFTSLDQQRGQFTAFSRQSFYAPFMPSGGFRYGIDSVAVPLAGDIESLGRFRTTFAEDEIAFRGGNAGARKTAQYLVTRVSESGIQVKLAPSKANGKFGQITNQLGSHIEMIVTLDEQGNWFVAEDVATGELVELEEAKDEARVAEFYGLIRKRGPEYPEGYFSRVNHYGRPSNVSSGEDGILGAMIENATDGNGLRPGEYFAIVTEAPWLPMPVAGIEEEASLHIVHGKWKVVP